MFKAKVIRIDKSLGILIPKEVADAKGKKGRGRKNKKKGVIGIRLNYAQ